MAFLFPALLFAQHPGALVRGCVVTRGQASYSGGNRYPERGGDADTYRHAGRVPAGKRVAGQVRAHFQLGEHQSAYTGGGSRGRCADRCGKSGSDRTGSYR